MARSVSVSLHLKSHDRSVASSDWHSMRLGGAWININIGGDDVTFHATREQLGDLYTVIGQCLTNLDVVAAERSAQEPVDVTQ